MKFINLLIFNPDKTRILAVKRSKDDPAFGGMWALPGGQIEKETVKNAAKRELYEETGLILKNISNKNIFSASPTLYGTKINLIVRQAEIKKYLPNPQDRDIEKVGWITPQKLIQSLKKFNIPDQETEKFAKKLFDISKIGNHPNKVILNIQTGKDKRPYRKGIISIIVDENNKYLVLQLNNYKDNEWNFLGGGRKKGETEEENLYRELKEELGCGKECFEILGKSKKRLKYKFPEATRDDYFKGRFNGQIKDQFLVKFKGDKKEIKILEDEIKRHKWISLEELSDHLLFPNQHQNAIEVIKELSS